MTLKNSFFKLLKEDFKRRFWVLLLSALVYFVTFPILFTMLLQQWSGKNYFEYVMNENTVTRLDRAATYVAEFVGMNWWLLIVAMVGAVICGISGFAFLHSKKQVDFYHSLPIKREKIFLVRFVNGILFFVVPYAVSILYVYIVSAFYGVMRKEIFLAATVGFFVNLMCFLVMYLVTILAMLLTGKMLMAFCGTTVFILYAPAMYGLVLTLKETFFLTQYSASYNSNAVWDITRWFSPVSYAVALFNKMTEAESFKAFWIEVLIFVVVAAVLGVLCLWLYKIRKSETCEAAMSFVKTESVFRMLIAVPVGVLVGYLLFMAQFSYSNAEAKIWLILGCLIGGFLAHAIIESLYRGDVKRCLSHKLQLGATMVIALVIPFLFYFDVFGFDSYLPKQEKLESVAVYSGEFRFYGQYMDEEGNWKNSDDYCLEEMELEVNDDVYALLEKLSESAVASRKERFAGSSEDSVIMYGDNGNAQFVIRYRFKNGKDVYRSYDIDIDAVEDSMQVIYDTTEYKNYTSPVLYFIDNMEKYSSVHVYVENPVNGSNTYIPRNQKELLELYKKEFMELTFDTYRNEAPIARLQIEYVAESRNNQFYETATAFIYPSMTETIDWLEAHTGEEIVSLQELDNIIGATIRFSGTDVEWEMMNNEEYNGNSYDVQVDYSGSYAPDEYYYDKYYYENYYEYFVDIEDPKEIKECLTGLIYSSYAYEFGYLPKVSNVFVELTFENPDAEEGEAVAWTETFRYLHGAVPEKVLQMLEDEKN